MADLDTIRTHARTIVEGEGREEYDVALVEAVARAVARTDWLADGYSERNADHYVEHIWRIFLPHARAALSTIRKHQAGE